MGIRGTNENSLTRAARSGVMWLVVALLLYPIIPFRSRYMTNPRYNLQKLVQNACITTPGA